MAHRSRRYWTGGPLRTTKRLLLIALLGLHSSQASAATFYINPAGNDANGCTSLVADACRTWTRIWAVAAGGDTIKMAAGTYDYSGAEITTPDSGSSGAYTILEATDAYNTDAAAFGPVFTQSGSLNVAHTVHHVKIRGVKFDYASGKSLRGQHIHLTDAIIRRGSGFNVNDGRLVIGDGDFNDTDFINVERVLIYGPGSRYGLNPFNAKNVTMREVVLRADGGWSDDKGDPVGPVSIYNSTGVVLADFIVLDSTEVSGVSYSGNQWQGSYVLYNGGSAGPVTNNVLVKQGGLLYVQGVGFRNDGLYVNDGVDYEDIFGVNTTDVFLSTLDRSVTVNRFTVGRFTGASTAQAFYSGGGITAKNGILFNWADEYGSGSFTYSTFYNSGSAPGGTGNNTTNPFSAGLSFPTRTEAASTMFTTGEASGPRGAQMVYQFGTRGTEYGESGYATLTATPLWPWTHAARWKEELASTNSRGFSAGSKDFCHYVNEALGNNADTLCATTVDSSSPTAPGTPTVTSTGTTTLDITYSASASTDTTTYELDADDNSDFSSPLGGYNDLDVGNVTAYQLTGLTASTQYYFRLRAKDAAGNTSSNSTAGTGTTNAEAPAVFVAPVRGTGSFKGGGSIRR